MESEDARHLFEYLLSINYSIEKFIKIYSESLQ